MTKHLARKTLAAAALALLGVAWALPALASPAMFSGFVTRFSAYNDICLPGYLFQGGDSPYPCTQAATTNASVMTGTGGFTLPAGQFALASAFTAVFPGYPYFGAAVGATNFTGSFMTGYFPKSLMTTIAVDTTGFPDLPSIPRAASVKITYGSAGFGGNMLLSHTHDYFGTVAGGFGSYDFTNYFHQLRGIGAPWNTDAVRGAKLHQTATTGGPTMAPVPAASLAGSSRFPFFTGTLMAYAPQGISVTTFTGSGADSRTSTFHASGMISLVAPNIVYSYAAVPDEFGTITILFNNFVSFDQINLNFLPEPKRLALLATGLLGLFALSRLRRR